jgi:hypothetical protein
MFLPLRIPCLGCHKRPFPLKQAVETSGRTVEDSLRHASPCSFSPCFSTSDSRGKRKDPGCPINPDAEHHDVLDSLWGEQTMKWPICRYLSYSVDSNTSDAQDLGRKSMAWNTCSLGWLIMATRDSRD